MITPELNKLNNKLMGLSTWDSGFSNNTWGRHNTECSFYDLVYNNDSSPCNATIAIIVTSWEGHLIWLKNTLLSYRKTNQFVILAYDNPFLSWNFNTPVDNVLPRAVHYLLANAVVNKHITYGYSKRAGWNWDILYAKGIISLFPNIKYVYCTNGDCLIEKPDGFPELIKILGDGDVMAGQSSGEYMHTASLLFKVEAFNKFADYVYNRVKTTVFGSASPELLLGEAKKKLNLKETLAPKQPMYSVDNTFDWYCVENQPSTFKDVIGFRNLGGEHSHLYHNENKIEDLEPLPKELFDNYNNWGYFPGKDRATLCKYFDTGDKTYLRKWRE
jgi:hypothetical protein